MQGTQLARQWRILRLLESRKRGLAAAELSTELDAPVRTVSRDLEAIQEAGFPVFTDRAEGHWRSKRVERVRLTFPFQE